MTAEPADNGEAATPGDHRHEHDPHHHHVTFVLDLEGKDYPWHEDTITVAQIRDLAGWPADQQVVEVDPKTNLETALDENTPIQLDAERHFGRKFKFKRGQR